jgi:hypothetical protein
MNNPIEISGLGIKPYVSSSKASRPSGAGYVLEAAGSRVVFDLTSFVGKLRVTIISKRLNGNGRVIIQNQETNVLSKIMHKTELELSEFDKLIEIHKDDSSSGKLLISSLIVQSITPEGDITETVDNMSDSWKNILNRCGNVKGIQLVKDKLMAVEGAYIQRADIVEKIITDPPQAFSIQDSVKFVYPCQILKIVLKPNITIDPPANPLYQHFTAPQKLVGELNEYVAPNFTNRNIRPNTNLLTNERTDNVVNTSVVYDSYINGLNPATLHNAYDIAGGFGSSRKGLLLSRNGKFRISISGIQPNIQYVIFATIKNQSGNGKLGFCFVSSDGVRRERSVFVPPAAKEKDHHFSLISGDVLPNGATYLLEVFRPENAAGEIIIDRIKIIQGISTKPYFQSEQPQQTQYEVPFNGNNNCHISGIDTSDLIQSSAKRYARYNYVSDENVNFNYSGNLIVTTLSGLNWYSKITKLCPGITLKNANVADESDFVISELGSLIPGKRFWIDAFNDINEISEKDDTILRDAKFIASPSFQNVEVLKKRYPNANVIELERAWPQINVLPTVFPTNDYILFFHKNIQLTQRIVDSWSEDLPKFVCVGYRGNLPNHVIPMNEYITYDKFLYIFKNSKAIIDLSVNDNYLSATLSLAHDLNIPVVTNNWLGITQNNSKFVILKDTDNDIKLPTIEDLNRTIKSTLNTSFEIINNDHNNKVNKFLSNCFYSL